MIMLKKNTLEERLKKTVRIDFKNIPLEEMLKQATFKKRSKKSPLEEMLKQATLEERLKYYTPKPASQTEWVAKPFFKTGLTFLAGPAQVGKLSLCVALACKKAEGLPLWHGDQPDGRRASVFTSGKLIISEHLNQKLCGQTGIKIIEGINSPLKIPPGVEPDGLRMNVFKHLVKKSLIHRVLKPNHIIPLAKLEKPAFFVFDFHSLFGSCKKTNSTLLKINAEAKNLPTAFICLVKSRHLLTDFKTIPQLSILKKGEDRFLIKKTGFADCPKGVLRFKLEHEKDRFVVQGLKYSDSCMLDKTEESQADRFKKILDKRKAEGKVMRTSEIKAEARKGGISTYFLQNLQWIDYGYQTKGEGYGSNFKQVLMPVERH